VKTIGVLGGIGPQATIDFETRLHRVAQQLIPQHLNSGYPPLVVYYCRHAPVRVREDGTPQFPIQADPQLFEAARRLGTLADFLVITANGPHMFQEQIEQAAGCRVLSMIEVTLADVHRRRWSRVGVLGFGDPLIYTKPLGEASIAYETLDAELRARLDRSIMEFMEGRDDAESTAVAREALASLRSRGVDGVILGCTEIPLLLHESVAEPDLINPSQLLAEETVRYAMA
jgi:aspartate racemase